MKNQILSYAQGMSIKKGCCGCGKIEDMDIMNNGFGVTTFYCPICGWNFIQYDYEILRS